MLTPYAILKNWFVVVLYEVIPLNVYELKAHLLIQLQLMSA